MTVWMKAGEVINLAITVGGLALACAGVALQWGTGAGLMVGGAVCFVAGALGGARAQRRELPPWWPRGQR